MNPCTDPEFCIPNPKGGHVPCPVCPHGAGALTCSPPSRDKDACCSETPKSDQLIEAQQALGTALKHLREARRELDDLREKADKAHQAFYTMSHDWKSCDFELPPLAIIHMEAITEKMKEMGKILFSLENAQQTCGESSDATETPNLLT